MLCSCLRIDSCDGEFIEEPEVLRLSFPSEPNMFLTFLVVGSCRCGWLLCSVMVSMESLEAVLVSEESDDVLVTRWSGEGPCLSVDWLLRLSFLVISSLALLVYSLGV